MQVGLDVTCRSQRNKRQVQSNKQLNLFDSKAVPAERLLCAIAVRTINTQIKRDPGVGGPRPFIVDIQGNKQAARKGIQSWKKEKVREPTSPAISGDLQAALWQADFTASPPFLRLELAIIPGARIRNGSSQLYSSNRCVRGRWGAGCQRNLWGVAGGRGEDIVRL